MALSLRSLRPVLNSPEGVIKNPKLYTNQTSQTNQITSTSGSLPGSAFSWLKLLHFQAFFGYPWNYTFARGTSGSSYLQHHYKEHRNNYFCQFQAADVLAPKIIKIVPLVQEICFKRTYVYRYWSNIWVGHRMRSNKCVKIWFNWVWLHTSLLCYVVRKMITSFNLLPSSFITSAATTSK